MRISLNEIKKYVPAAAEVSTDELVTLIGSRLVEVEEKIDLAPKYAGAYIVRVMECEPIPDTHLHLCQIDAGNLHPSQARSWPLGQADGLGEVQPSPQQSSLVQVVCGAPNVHKGMLAVWLAPGAIVPQTYGNEDFKLDVRKLRGYESYGMLAGLDELDLGDDHSGIVEIDPSMDFGERNVQPGDSFAEVFGLNDVILDIENKSLTHRPDTFGLIGFAREVAGILGVEFAEPEPEKLADKISSDIEIKIEDAEICPRYSCAVVNLKDPLAQNKYLTPDAIFLAKAGMRSISEIVDIANILMLETGQPLHTFDYDKFIAVGGSKKPVIGVRVAKDGEELQLLDGKTIACTPDDILITSNNVPVALAGAMGGASTEIDASTTRVLVESATFSLYHLRKTQMKHGIFSEAITRFTKGQPASQTLPVLTKALNLLGGEVETLADSYPGKNKTPVVKITSAEINGLLGTKYSEEKIIKTLENVGFKVAPGLEITAPEWRTDIHIKEDIIEEVGRLNGYDNIPQVLPLRPFVATKPDAMFSFKKQLRQILSDNLNAHEVLSYSFVSKKLQETVGEDSADSYEIVNSISPELQCVRQSLIPSLLEKVSLNLKAGYKDFTLYEMNQVSKKSYGLDAEGVPILEHHLAVVVTGDYYQAKAVLSELLRKLGLLDLDFQEFKGAKYFEPLHAAVVQPVRAELGEIRGSVLKKLKISQPVAAFELNLETLLDARPTATAHIAKLSKFPSVDRDLTLKAEASTPYVALAQKIEAALSQQENLIYHLEPASVYQKDERTKNVSFRLNFASTKKTLESAEISAIMGTVINAVKTLGVEVV